MCKRLSCKLLEGLCILTSEYILGCCNNPVIIAKYDGKNFPADEILASRRQMRFALENNQPCLCAGCPDLQYTNWPDDDEKYLISERLSYIAPSPCNLHCCYCYQVNWRDSIAYKPGAFSLVASAREIIAAGYLAPQATVSMSSGEPTIRADFTEWLRIFSEQTKNSLLIFSNATVFSEELACLLRSGRGSLVVSLDGCSRATYKKITKQDKFDSVLANLKKYQGNGLLLKHIVLPENAHESPDDFLNIAEDLGVQKVCLAMDFARLPPSPAQLDSYAAWVLRAEERGFICCDDFFFEPVPPGKAPFRPLSIQNNCKYAPEVMERFAWHRQGETGPNHYQLPPWSVLLRDDQAFAGELHFLLTGKVLSGEKLAEQAQICAASPSRFGYSAQLRRQTSASATDWLAVPPDYALLWRIESLLFCRKPTTERLKALKAANLPLGLMIRQAFLSILFCPEMSGTGKNTWGLRREDVIFLHALLLLQWPESEESILRAMLHPSLLQVADKILASDAFRLMNKNRIQARTRPCAELKLKDLLPSVNLQLWPARLRNLLGVDGETTLFALWARQISHLKPLKAFAPGIGRKQVVQDEKNILCFGTGSMAVNLVPALDQKALNILAYIDERTEKRGSVFMGAPVLGLEQAMERSFDYVLVCARPFELIKNKLLRAGVPEEKIVSGDLEAGAYQTAYEQNEFAACAEDFITRSPVRNALVDREKLRASTWFAYAKRRWMEDTPDWW